MSRIDKKQDFLPVFHARKLIRQWRTVRERDRVRFKQESREESRLELGHDSTLLALVNPSRYLTRTVQRLAQDGYA